MTDTTHPTDRTDQLPLLELPQGPASLRLDARTRRVGLAGVARARAILADQARRRVTQEFDVEQQRRHPPQHPAAA